MTKRDKIKEECDRLTMEFAELYGDDHLIIGRTRKHTYMSIPDDAKVLGDLVERMLMGIAMKDKAKHFEAVLDAVARVAMKVKEEIDRELLN